MKSEEIIKLIFRIIVTLVGRGRDVIGEAQTEALRDTVNVLSLNLG